MDFNNTSPRLWPFGEYHQSHHLWWLHAFRSCCLISRKSKQATTLLNNPTKEINRGTDNNVMIFNVIKCKTYIHQLLNIGSKELFGNRVKSLTRHHLLPCKWNSAILIGLRFLGNAEASILSGVKKTRGRGMPSLCTLQHYRYSRRQDVFGMHSGLVCTVSWLGWLVTLNMKR